MYENDRTVARTADSASQPTSPDRRGLLAAALAGVFASGATTLAQAAPVAPANGSISVGGTRLRIVDLTHELTKDFNWVPTSPRVMLEPSVNPGLAVGMSTHRAWLSEHTGTHIDAPSHFSREGKSLGEMPLSDLVVPLAVVDLRKRFESDPNAGLVPDDVLQWERQHGRLPENCCVAMFTGYDPLVRHRPTLRKESPGFTPEAVKFLIEERSVKGIATDAMSLDQGTAAPTFPAHQVWLRSGRWGIEGLANLEAVAAAGAVLIVGAPPVKGATGFPIRAMAIF